MAKRKGPGRPRIPKNEQKRPFPMRLRPDLIKRIEDKATRCKKKVTQIAEETLTEFIDWEGFA
jgi:predicted transcriptional regulator